MFWSKWETNRRQAIWGMLFGTRVEFMFCLCNLGFIIHKNVQYAACFDSTSNAKHSL